jgi:AsmA family protein
VVDTRDSTLWISGKASLATEDLALVAHTAPKDITPLSLRSPVHIDGKFSDVDISIEKKPLLQRLVPAVLLGTLVTPLAAIIPLIDFGSKEARSQLGTCQKELAQRTRGRNL